MRILSPLALWRSDKGATAVEFALVAMPLLMLALGVFEFGRYSWTLEAIQASAVSGARCIGISEASCVSGGTYNSASTVTYVQTVAAGWNVSLPSSDIVPSNNTTCGGLTGFAQVQINYLFNTIVPNIIPISTNGKTMTATSCFPINPSS